MSGEGVLTCGNEEGFMLKSAVALAIPRSRFWRSGSTGDLPRLELGMIDTTHPSPLACTPESPCRVRVTHHGYWDAPPQLPWPISVTAPEEGGWTFTGSVTPVRYLVGWSDGVVKIGATLLGRSRRIPPMVKRGASVIHLSYYQLDDLDHAEAWLLNQASLRWSQAFDCRHDAAAHLPRGGGWTECFRVPAAERGALLELAAR